MRIRLVAGVVVGLFLSVGFCPAQSLEVGQSVLARWDIREEFYFYPGTIKSMDDGFVDIVYADGSESSIPRGGVLGRSLQTGDLVESSGGMGLVLAPAKDGVVRVHGLGSPEGTEAVRPLADLRALLRTDGWVRDSPSGATYSPGDRVWAKWDERSWYVAKVARTAGEGVEVHYEDGSTKWVPVNFVVPLKLDPEMTIFAVNPRDGQPFPAELVAMEGRRAKLKFFDGAVRSRNSSQLIVFRDQIGLDLRDPCDRVAKKSSGSRWDRHRKTLRSWLEKKIHYYDADRETLAFPGEVELGFAVFVPEDRELREDWRKVSVLLAGQVARFLERELNVGVTAFVHDTPVRGEKSLAWYRKNLDEEDSWHDWIPTGQAVRAVFPDGAVAGKHRVVVLLPDTPGLSADDSGVEEGMGFVRADGEWLEKLTVAGIESVDKIPGNSFHDEWRSDYLATTLAHEVLHTFGLPHTDGDPWSVMNLGPWYPITREEIHVAELHRLILTSPFRSLSLSQGYVKLLLDEEESFLDTISQRERGDVRIRLYYSSGDGWPSLERLLESFGPESRCRFGAREDTGERAYCRAYLASFVAFLLEKKGPAALKALFAIPDGGVDEAVAKGFSTSLNRVQSQWHDWLRKTVPTD